MGASKNLPSALPRKKWYQTTLGIKPAKTRRGKRIRFFVMLGITIAFVLVAAFAQYMAPYDPIATDLTQSLNAPSAAHLAGTDKLGRDVFSRILCGAGNSFSMTFIMVIVVSVIGTAIGMACGYFGGKLDTCVMRFVDILLAFPDTVFAIAVAGMLGPGLLNTVLALSFIGWTRYARMTRSLTASIKARGYVTQARFNGASTPRILLRYILPNVAPQLVVMAAMSVGGTMLSLAGLSFLGLASQPPTAEWGFMIYESRQYIQTAPWMMIFPGIALFMTVVVFNLLGDALRDFMDIKM